LNHFLSFSIFFSLFPPFLPFFFIVLIFIFYTFDDDCIVNDYLVKKLHEIAIGDMSTGLSFGFLFRNTEEFEDLLKFIENYCSNNN